MKQAPGETNKGEPMTKLATNTMGDRKWHKSPREGTENM